MITREDDVDIHALRRQGWTITAIAQHVGRDRKTVRDYLNGKREPGVRKRALDPFAPFVDYVTARLTEDPHLWGITLFDELQSLGFDASYPTLTRQIRARRLRPVCTDCGRVTERANAIIPHPAGEETQWDWVDLPYPGRCRIRGMAGCARREHRPAASGRRPTLGRHRPGWGEQGVAV